MNRPSEPLGIYGKYRIEKTDGTPLVPTGSMFIRYVITDAGRAALRDA